MKNEKFNRYAFVGLVLALALACTFSSAAPTPESPGSAPLTDASSAPPTPTPVQHLSVPGELPEERSSHAGDHDTSATADRKQAVGGDRFTFGRFERPFNSETMDVYFPDLDIQDTLFYQDESWIYAVVTLKGPGEGGGLAGSYAVEIDADADGGGDWLILVRGPASDEWSTSGVQVWSDANDDVGGDDTYLAGMWAGNTILDPALFDLNDHYTHEQAGAALIDLEYFYPIKAVAELDNSCRVAIGFQPSGSEPGLCPIAAPEATGCKGQIFCYNFGQQQVCYCIE